MHDNKKRLIRGIITIFSISMLIIVFLTFNELKFIGQPDQNVQLTTILVTLKAVVLFFTFLISIIFVNHMFNKEANFDYKTGLFSRKRMDQDLNKLVSKKTPFALCVIDFNGFKAVNDNHGHGAGDILLKEFSRKIKRLHIHGIKSYRYGGDEFVAIITAADIQSCLQNICKIAGDEVRITFNQTTPISFAMGVVENDYLSSPEKLLERADAEMYKNKRS